MRSKHIEYMNIAMSILLFVSVIIHPEPSTHWAFSWTPEKHIHHSGEKEIEVWAIKTYPAKSGTNDPR